MDTHRTAYWLTVDITTPWEDLPGAVRATRDATANHLTVDLVRAGTVTFDLDLARLALHSPLTVDLAPLDEPTYDPDLAAGGEPQETTLVLATDLSDATSATVLVDGVPLDSDLVDLHDDGLTIGPVTAAADTGLEVHVTF